MVAIKVNLKVVFVVWGLGFTWGFDDEELIWKCGRETGLDADTIVWLNETKNTFFETDNELFKCYFKCIFEKTGWMSSEGKLQVGIYDDENKKEEFEHIVMDCMTVKGDYPCQTAYLFHECILTKKQEEEEEEEPEGHEEQGKQEQEGEGKQEQGQQEEKGEGQTEKGQQEEGQGNQEEQPEEQQDKN